MSVLEPSDYWERIAARLRELGVEPVLIGALAAAEHRHRKRYTTDVDFLCREALTPVVTAMEADGYSVKTMTQPGEHEPYVIFIRGMGVQVDLLRAETPFQESVIDRAVDGIATAEDIIVFKLLAWRPRDQDDIDSIFAAGHHLDDAYIERWATEWEVSERWEEAKLRRL